MNFTVLIDILAGSSNCRVKSAEKFHFSCTYLLVCVLNGLLGPQTAWGWTKEGNRLDDSVAGGSGLVS